MTKVQILQKTLVPTLGVMPPPAPGTTTLVGKLYEPVATGATRAEKIASLKEQAHKAMQPLSPRLEQLKAQQTIDGYELLWLTGNLGVSVPEAKAASALHALGQVEGLQGVTFSKSQQLVRLDG